MESVDDEAAMFLKKTVVGKSSSDNPMQVLREVQSWNGLLSRPKVKKLLQGER